MYIFVVYYIMYILFNVTTFIYLLFKPYKDTAIYPKNDLKPRKMAFFFFFLKKISEKYCRSKNYS